MTFLLWSYAIVEIKRVEFMCVQCYIFFISLLDLIIFRHIDFYWRLDASRTKCVCCTNIEQIDSNVIGLASIIPVWIHGIFSHLRECRKYSCQFFMYFATGSLCAWIRRDETSIIHLVSVAQCWSYTNITWIFKLFHWNNIYFVKQKINNLFECSSIEQNLVIVTDIL